MNMQIDVSINNEFKFNLLLKTNLRYNGYNT